MSAAPFETPSSSPAEVDLRDASLWQDMHAATRAWREAHPLAFAPLSGAWFVLRHADVLRLLGDARLAGGYGTLGEGPSGRVMNGLLANQSGERHARLRRLVAHAFTPRRIDGMRAALRTRVRSRLAALAPGRALDFQREVADPLAREAISDPLGVPEAEAATFSGWVAALLRGQVPTASPAERAAADAAAASLFAYLAELAARRRREPGDSLLDALLAAEDADGGVSAADLEQVVMSVLAGGTDTVRSFLGIVTWLLLQRPEARARLAAAPELAPAFVEEALRFEPPLSGVPRVATEDLAYHGCVIPAGSPVILGLLSANRDPRRFPEPDRFEPLRDASAQLSFGRGTHFCVGAALARMEAQELLLGLVAEDTPRLALAETPRWVPFSPARRLEALLVKVAEVKRGRPLSDTPACPPPPPSTS